jgi:hypothetical protein
MPAGIHGERVTHITFRTIQSLPPENCRGYAAGFPAGHKRCMAQGDDGNAPMPCLGTSEVFEGIPVGRGTVNELPARHAKTHKKFRQMFTGKRFRHSGAKWGYGRGPGSCVNWRWGRGRWISGEGRGTFATISGGLGECQGSLACHPGICWPQRMPEIGLHLFWEEAVKPTGRAVWRLGRCRGGGMGCGEHAK